MAAVDRSQAGIASGLLNAARQVGGIVGVAVFGFWVRGVTVEGFMAGLELALVVSVGLLVVGAGVGFVGLRWGESGVGVRA